jgi:endonuclease/exonuclease/phosphatase family metal-dependent hydrolase
MRRSFFSAALAAATLLAAPGWAPAASSTLVINEVDYDQQGTDTAEFVELRNVSDEPVFLGGHTLRGRNGGLAGVPIYSPVNLPPVELAAGDYWVVCANAATVANCDQDVSPNTDYVQNGPTDALELVQGSTVIDTVSYEGATPGHTEGAAGAPADEPAPASAPPDPPRGIARIPDGCDTDQNGTDFKVAPISPGASNGGGDGCAVAPTDTAPAVEDSDPGNGDSGVDRDTNITVTFTEPVEADDEAFSLTCNGADVPLAVIEQDPQRTVLDPQETLPAGASCTLSVDGGGYRDEDLDDPPDNGVTYTATFTTRGFEGLRIHDIQGRQHISPFNNAPVLAVPGVVTALRSNGFYYQDPQPDADPRTSEGIFVFTSGPPTVAPGEAVTVSGTVSEFRRGGGTNLTITQITRPEVTPAGTGTIAPTIVGRGGRVPPNEIVDNDTVDPGGEDPTTFGGDLEAKSRPFPQEQDPTFDPEQDGIDFHESLEGMLTQINRATAVAPTSDFGSNREIPVVADGGADANVLSPRGTLVVRGFDRSAPQEYRLGDFNPERLILNDLGDPRGAFLPFVDTRDRLTQPVRAVVDYSFGNFKYLVVSDPRVADGRLEPERTRSRDRDDELAVASYNVENLDGLDPQERYDRIARQITYNLRSPDILSLEEVQDNDGATSPAPTQADVTYKRLIEAIRRAGGPVYDYRQIDPAPASDGGEPGGNIRVAFLFRKDRRDLRFVDRPGGNATTPTEPAAAPGGGAQLTLSPGRIDPTNPVWSSSRKPLAGEFRYRGRPLFVVGNHFNSKGGDDPVFGRFQEPRRSSENQRRGSATDPSDTTRGQAGVVNAWVRRLLDIDRRARVVVLGDLNDFDFSETLRVLEEGDEVGGSRELVNLFHFLPRSQRYTYVFQGNAQVLDHILVSPFLLFEGRPDLDVVHMNAEFFDQASDHDPPITRIEIDDDDDRDDDDDDRDDDDDDRDDDDDD